MTVPESHESMFLGYFTCPVQLYQPLLLAVAVPRKRGWFFLEKWRNFPSL